MMQTCAQCGAVYSPSGLCPTCHPDLSSENSRRLADSASAPATEGNLALAFDWRSEVAGRLEAYRDRRRKLCHNSGQTQLPFDRSPRPAADGAAARVTPFELKSARPRPSASAQLVEPASAPVPRLPDRAREPAGLRRRVASRAPAHADPFEIDLAQPALDFESVPESNRPAQRVALACAVASLGVRSRAGLLDAAFITSSCGCFFAVFHALGGQLSPSRVALGVMFGAAVILYALYFGIFTLMGGATPGMRLCGLAVAGLDGSVPEPRRLFRRYFGCLASSAMLLLGFAWTLCDDDGLSWHDRLSGTCIVPAGSVAGNGRQD